MTLLCIPKAGRSPKGNGVGRLPCSPTAGTGMPEGGGGNQEMGSKMLGPAGEELEAGPEAARPELGAGVAAAATPEASRFPRAL
jgi:hypothetical protein